MASLFQKGRTVTLGFLHDLLDKVIDVNSPSALRQHIRDLEGAIDSMSDTVAAANATTRGLNRDVVSIQGEMSKLNGEIDLILSDGDDSNDHLALPREARLADLEGQLTDKSGEKVTAEQTASALNQALSNLKTKHASMIAALKKLESLDKSTKAKEQAASALKQAADLAATGSGVSVDSVTARMQQRADVADEKFKQAMGAVQESTGEDVAIIEAKRRLAERKARLKQGTVTQALS